MSGSLDLTHSELQLLAGLLERERGELPAEIRRSGFSSVRDDFKYRLRFVEDLQEKIKQLSSQVAA